MITRNGWQAHDEENLPRIDCVAELVILMTNREGQNVRMGPFAQLHCVDDMIYAGVQEVAEFQFEQDTWYFYAIQGPCKRFSVHPRGRGT